MLRQKKGSDAEPDLFFMSIGLHLTQFSIVQRDDAFAIRPGRKDAGAPNAPAVGPSRANDAEIS
jgi:hypothetical protein